MRGLLPYAWRSLVARPARTVLTAFGIAIGVAVLVAALAVDAGLDASIDRTVASQVGRADLRVAAFADAGLSGRTLAAIDAVPGVAVAAPTIERHTFLVAGSGRPAGAPVTVLGVDAGRELGVRDLDVVRGWAPTTLAPDEVLVSERLADAEGLDVGDSVTLLGAGAPVRARIGAVLAGDGPAAGSLGRTIVTSLETATQLATPDGSGLASSDPAALRGLSRIDIVLAVGADPAAVEAELERTLTTEPYLLTSPQDVAAALRASTADVRATMALLAAISLFAAAFVILNTIAMTVVERVRELALLRAAGATRGQVGRVVVTQGLLLGALGSVLGIAAGAVLAAVAAAWLRTAGDVTLDGPVVTPWAIIAGIAAGIIVALVAAVEPARRAGAVSPVEALRARSDATAGVRAHAGWLLVVMAAVGVLAAVLVPGIASSGALSQRTIVVYVVLLAAVLATPALLGPLGRVAGLPFARVFRLEERLARAAIARDRGRTTITVGALVVGLAMVVALGVVAVNARTAATAWLDDVVPGDEILTAIAPAPVGDDGYEPEIARIDGVARVTPMAAFDLSFEGTRLPAVAIRGADLAADGRLTFAQGDRATALAAIDTGGSVILPVAEARTMGVGVGDTVVVATAAGPVELAVAGLVDRSFPGAAGEAALVGWSDALGRFGVLGADAFVVRFASGQAAAAMPAVDDLARQLALTPAPVARVAGTVGDALDRVFGLLDLLALAAVIVAGFGIANTLSMDSWERSRELGVLRAAGMSRRQVWRSVLVEAGILGVIGGAVGVVTGLVVGTLLLAFAGGLPSAVQIPWLTIAVSLAMAVGLAMLAAAQPARIAGRRSIVAAVRGA